MFMLCHVFILFPSFMCYFLFHPVYLHLPVTEVQVKVQHVVVLQRCGFTRLFTTVSCFTPVATDCFCLIHRYTLQTVKGYFATLNLPQDCSLSLSDYLHKNKMLKKKNKFQRSRFIFLWKWNSTKGTLLEKAVS